jgi:thiamine biosynthesis lipoprotein
LLFEALELALEAARKTGGDLDPTLGRALELIGYDRDWRLLDPPARQPERQPHEQDVPAPLALNLRERAGWRALVLDRAAHTARLPQGVRLDLGATAKALAADRAATAAHAASGYGVLVSLGGDIATAGPGLSGGWRIHVTDDHRNDASAPGQTISIHSGGLATSSTTVRRWNHNGQTMHHILDPATGAPLDSCWRTVSVAADSCAHANIASTAALVRGERAPAWLQTLGLPARLQDRSGSVTRVGQWPAQRQESMPHALDSHHMQLPTPAGTTVRR